MCHMMQAFSAGEIANLMYKCEMTELLVWHDPFVHAT